MSESEDQLLARIAKHNGVTIEEEREKALRRKLGAKDVEESLAKDAQPISDQPSSSAVVGHNPFLISLVVLTAIFCLVGIILYIIGSAQNPLGDDPAASLPLIVAANSWLGFATVTLLAALVVGGINWQISRIDK